MGTINRKRAGGLRAPVLIVIDPQGDSNVERKTFNHRRRRGQSRHRAEFGRYKAPAGVPWRLLRWDSRLEP